MQYEVEQKFALLNLASMRDQLRAMGATIGSPIDQVDHYFGHPARDFAETDEALRLREAGGEVFITYKGPKIDSQTKTRREIELPLPADTKAAEQFSELLLALGFRAVSTVRKRREPGCLQWEGQDVHIALDQVDGLGDYLELEMLANDTRLPIAEATLANLARKLDLQRSERRSYLELLLGS